MATTRIWDADNGVWQRIGGPPNVVDPTEPASPLDGLIWTNPTDGVSKIWDADGDEWIVVGTGAGGGGGAGHVVDPVEPVAPEDGLLWTNPAELAIADPAYLPKGILAWVQRTSAAPGLGAGTVFDIITLPSITVPAGRRLRITQLVCYRNAGAGSGQMNLWIDRGAGSIHRTYESGIGSGEYRTPTLVTFDNPPAGSHIYKFKMRMDSMAWDLLGDPYSYIAVEDVGLA
jgi:hypothetical protein